MPGGLSLGACDCCGAHHRGDSSRLRKEGQQLDKAPHSVTTWALPDLL